MDVGGLKDKQMQPLKCCKLSDITACRSAKTILHRISPYRFVKITNIFHFVHVDDSAIAQNFSKMQPLDLAVPEHVPPSPLHARYKPPG